jgi:hypothetical protein
MRDRAWPRCRLTAHPVSAHLPRILLQSAAQPRTVDAAGFTRVPSIWDEYDKETVLKRSIQRVCGWVAHVRAA